MVSILAQSGKSYSEKKTAETARDCDENALLNFCRPRPQRLLDDHAIADLTRADGEKQPHLRQAFLKLAKCSLLELNLPSDVE